MALIDGITRAQTIATTVPTGTDRFLTSGYAVAGDGGAGEYVRSAGEPTMPSRSNLVKNATWTSDGAGWTTSANWTLGSGMAVVAGSAATNLDYSLTLPAGVSFQISYELLNVTSGSVTRYITDSTGATILSTGPIRSSAGIYIETITGISGSVRLRFTNSASAALSLRNISIRAIVTIPGSFQDAGGAWFRLASANADCRQFGLNSSLSASATRSAIQSCFDYAAFMQGSAYVPPGGSGSAIIYDSQAEQFVTPAWVVDGELYVDDNTTYFGSPNFLSAIKISPSTDRWHNGITNRHNYVGDDGYSRYENNPGNHNFTIYNIAIDGAYSSRPANITMGDASGCCFAFANCRSFKVYDCYGRGSAKHGIDVSAAIYGRENAEPAPGPSEDWSIYRFQATRNGDDGITTHASGKGLIADCFSWKTNKRVSENSNCFEIDDGSYEISIVNPSGWGGHRGVEIKGHGDAIPARDVTVINPQFWQCSKGIGIRHIANNTSPFAKNILVVGGYLRDFVYFEGVAGQAIEVQSYSGVRVVGTIMDGMGATVTNLDEAVLIWEGASDVEFKDVVIRDFPACSFGFRITSTAGAGHRFSGSVINSGRSRALRVQAEGCVVGDHYIKAPSVVDADSVAITGANALSPGWYDTSTTSYVDYYWSAADNAASVSNVRIHAEGLSGLDGTKPIICRLHSLAGGVWTAGAKFAGIAFSHADQSSGGGANLKSGLFGIVEDVDGRGAGVAVSTSATNAASGLLDRWTWGRTGDYNPVADNTYSIGTSDLRVKAVFVYSIDSVSGLYVNGIKVLSSRATGWGSDTGTAKRTANATYSATAGSTYTQSAEQALMNAVRDLSQTVKALKDDLIAHGVIGA